MAPRPAKESRENYEAGKCAEWSTGGYGSTVRVRSDNGRITIYWQHPATKKTKQKRLFSADSRELRKEATRAAVEFAELLRAGALQEEEQKAPAITAENLTLFDACLLYMQGRAPGFTAEMMEWGQGKLERWAKELSGSVRESMPGIGTIRKDLDSFRTIFAHPRFPRDRKVLTLEPGDWRAAQQEWLETYSPRTVANWRDRLSLVFRDIRINHRQSIGLLYNPLDGAKVVRTKARIPAYTDEERAKLLKEARKAIQEGRYWRLWVLLGIAHSGRRVEAMLSLTAAVHDLAAGTVTWKAEFAKADNYGRGDDVRRMTELHRAAVAWALEHKPNPLGPEYPLIWKTKNPAQPARYNTLRSQWHQLEEDAGVKTIRGRAFHSMRRAIVTLLSAELDVEAAADYVGMTPLTANTYHYRQTLDKTMGKAVDAINRTSEESE